MFVFFVPYDADVFPLSFSEGKGLANRMLLGTTIDYYIFTEKIFRATDSGLVRGANLFMIF